MLGRSAVHSGVGGSECGADELSALSTTSWGYRRLKFKAWLVGLGFY